MSRLALLAPAGGLLRIADGGVAIETVEGILRAPCGGVVRPGASAQAGLRLWHASRLEVDLRIGSGLDGGSGIEWLVVEAQPVSAGDELLRFDPRRCGRAIAWLRLTAGGRVAWCCEAGPVQAGEVIMEVDAGGTPDSPWPVPKSGAHGDGRR